MSRGVVSAEVFRSEQVSRLARMSDPSNADKGDAWIREDIQPVTDSVAALRIQGDSGFLEAPLFDPSVSLSQDVYVGQRFVFDDGSEGHLLVTDQGGAVGSPRVVTSSGTEYEAHDSTEISAIPDSMVSRPSDDSSGSYTDQYGVIINSKVNWPSIGVQLSSNTGSGVSTAYIYRVSDSTLIQSTDISGLSGGDAFIFDQVNLSADTDYAIVVDNNGSSYTGGFVRSFSPPYTSADGDLTIVDGAKYSNQNSNINANNIETVGDVGFS